MTGLVVLDVVISLIFIFFIVSLLVSQIVEVINTSLRRRENFLLSSIAKIFGEDGMTSNDLKNNTDKTKKSITAMLYHNPLISSLAKNSKRIPSHIGSSLFARVIIQELSDDKSIGEKAEEFTTRLEKLIKKADEKVDSKSLKKLFETLSEGVKDMNTFISRIEDWYDDRMGEVSSWFKNNTRWILFAVGILIAFVFNIDTLHMIERLWKDSSLRDEFVQTAAQAVDNPNAYSNDVNPTNALNQRTVTLDTLGNISSDSTAPQTSPQTLPSSANVPDTLSSARTQVNSYLLLEFQNLPVGWQNCHWGFCAEELDSRAAWQVVGWLITAIAVSFGAPFWFQLLNQLVSLRKSVAPRSSSRSNNAG